MVNRGIATIIVASLVMTGCAGVDHVKRPEGPFTIALLATSDTRGELEPCG